MFLEKRLCSKVSLKKSFKWHHGLIRILIICKNIFESLCLTIYQKISSQMIYTFVNANVAEKHFWINIILKLFFWRWFLINNIQSNDLFKTTLKKEKYPYSTNKDVAKSLIRLVQLNALIHTNPTTTWTGKT